MNNTANFFELFIKGKDKVCIDLGCGTNKKKGYIGIDRLQLDGVDFVANFEDGLEFIPDHSVDEIFSSHVLEHVDNLEFLLFEIHRVLKPNGTKTFVVPHFSNPYYYSDYTHKRFFGLYSMDYFAEESNMRRKVPTFYNEKKFVVLERRLVFKSPFFIRNKIKVIITKLINISTYTQELYEELFSGFIGCSEIRFKIKPKK